MVSAEKLIRIMKIQALICLVLASAIEARPHQISDQSHTDVQTEEAANKNRGFGIHEHVSTTSPPSLNPRLVGQESSKKQNSTKSVSNKSSNIDDEKYAKVPQHQTKPGSPFIPEPSEKQMKPGRPDVIFKRSFDLKSLQMFMVSPIEYKEVPNI